MVRSWFSLLLVVSYLLIAGMGFINRPSELRFAVAQSHAHQIHHHQDRYDDFDGMDLGIDLADLSADVQAHEDQTADQPMVRVVGIDAHCLPDADLFTFFSFVQPPLLTDTYRLIALTPPSRSIDAPPQQE